MGKIIDSDRVWGGVVNWGGGWCIVRCHLVSYIILVGGGVTGVTNGDGVRMGGWALITPFSAPYYWAKST